jgi:hypothetical protein
MPKLGLLGICMVEMVGTTDDEADLNAFPMLLLRLRRAESDFLRVTSNVDDLEMEGIGGSGGVGNAVTLFSPHDLADAAVAVRGRNGGG